jgi:hypothetical protein
MMETPRDIGFHAASQHFVVVEMINSFDEESK